MRGACRLPSQTAWQGAYTGQHTGDVHHEYHESSLSPVKLAVTNHILQPTAIPNPFTQEYQSWPVHKYGRANSSGKLELGSPLCHPLQQLWIPQLRRRDCFGARSRGSGLLSLRRDCAHFPIFVDEADKVHSITRQHCFLALTPTLTTIISACRQADLPETFFPRLKLRALSLRFRPNYNTVCPPPFYVATTPFPGVAELVGAAERGEADIPRLFTICVYLC